jgi:phosphoribosylaminoimidazole (AIR) synthetase
MESIAQPKITKVYQLIKQSGTHLTSAGSLGSMNWGTGFYITLAEAEHSRTMEMLKNTDPVKPQFHIFELDIPNPAYQEK